ncbi:MAG: aldehyde dehydrogenase family protein [Candidatus Kapabacteria bacterium]|nr:aldehyde dehydrogenase family protein [Candidatus Kapabacteria bacterium]
MNNFINNTWLPSETGRTFDNLNPADATDVIGAFPRSSAEDVNAAVSAAAKAFAAWRLVPAPKRGDILRRAGDIFTRRKDELAEIMTREMGKTVTETKGDIQEAIDTAYYAATETRRLFGYTAPSEMSNKMNMSFRMPIGVCGIITAWNFPIAVPSWKILPALAAGNTVVFKPSDDSPHSANIFAEILLEAGLPEGVFNVVHGDAEAGQALVEHPDVRVVGFTGSTTTGKAIAARCGELNKKVSLEMGGKNAQIVMEDGDLDLALNGVLWGAFGTTGQRCTATSRLILHEAIHDAFVDRLVAAASKLVLGDGRKNGTEVGPVINQRQLDKILSYIEIGKSEATCVAGGERDVEADKSKGYFVKPTIFTNVQPHHRIFQEEIFGPVLSIAKARSFDEAIAMANNCQYGLSSSIYTRDVNRAFAAIRDIEAGITYINAPTIGAEAHMPFGGIKGTGNGHREGGWTVFDIFTEWKTVYVDYSGHLQRAQIDNY